jgi:hypothetical protein
MRLILLLLAALLATPALGAEWSSYENPRFGYELLVPPDYGPDGPPPENGDGRVFIRDDGSQLLRVYGGNLVDRDFEDAVGLAMDAATDRGWALSYKRVTPRWASYSGTRNGMILYARAITLCGGTQFASFEIEYPDDDLAAMNSVIDKMVPSLKATGKGIDC